MENINIINTCDINEDELKKCIILINNNFKSNRISEYYKLILYKKNNKIIGFIGINNNYLNQLCVDINYRNKGIATLLLSVARQHLKGTIYLFVDKNGNEDKLIKFYIKNGYSIEYENNEEYKLKID
jgi:ribosomal protein S18 acetylase RimI-like enzyme